MMFWQIKKLVIYAGDITKVLVSKGILGYLKVTMMRGMEEFMTMQISINCDNVSFKENLVAFVSSF